MNGPQQKQDFSQRLKEARTRRGWSQKRVAEQLGIHVRTVSRWERGNAFPIPSLHIRLGELFAISIEELGLGEAQKHVGSSPFLFDPTILLPPVYLIGRDTHLAHLKYLLLKGGNVALSALNGLPGVGKTALALTLAHDLELHEQFKDGVLWAGLGPHPHLQSHLSRWGILLGMSAGEMNAFKSTEDWSMALHQAIGARAMLLVIDDAWKLEDALAFKVGGPGCAHLITTRFPPIASQLTVESALVINELDNEQGLLLLSLLAPQVVERETEQAHELVRAVGGLPLALTLIGNYLRRQSYGGPSQHVASTLGSLHDASARLDLTEPLAQAEKFSRSSQERSTSLRTIIALSDQQLEEQERQALYALSVFPSKPNSFSEEAGLVIATCTVNVLDILVDTGLLESGSADRYTLHQTIADYARLQRTGKDTYERLISYISELTEKQSQNYALLERESQNILAALDAAFEELRSHDLIRIACSIAPFLLARGNYHVAETHLQRARHAALDETDQLHILFYLGEILQRQSRYEEAERCFQEGLAIARRSGASDQITIFLALLGTFSWKRGEYHKADQYLQEGLVIAHQDGEQTYLYRILETLSSLAQRQGNNEQSEVYIREAITLFRAHPDYYPEQLSTMLNNLGTAIAKQGRYQEAEQTLKEGLELARESGNLEWVAAILNNLGDLMKIHGEYTQAACFLQEGLEIARQIGQQEWVCVLLQSNGEVARRQGDFASARSYVQQGLEMAQSLPLPQMAALGLFECGQIALHFRQLAEAEQYFQEMRSSIPEGDQELTALADYGFAQLYAARGDIESAQHLVERAIEKMAMPEAHEVRQWLRDLGQN